MYAVRKLSVTSSRNDDYSDTFEQATWADLMDDLARRADHGGNDCFYGRGAHVYRDDEFLGPLDVLTSIDKPFRQTTLTDFREAWANDCRNEPEDDEVCGD